MPSTAVSVPSAVPRSRPSYRDASNAIPVAKSAAAPTPCTPRRTISIPADVASPLPSEPTAKTVSAVR